MAPATRRALRADIRGRSRAGSASRRELLTVAYDAGLRRSERIAIRWTHIHVAPSAPAGFSCRAPRPTGNHPALPAPNIPNRTLTRCIVGLARAWSAKARVHTDHSTLASQNQSVKTPLLAAEGFMILRILIRQNFGEHFQHVGGKYLTAWGWFADLVGAEG